MISKIVDFIKKNKRNLAALVLIVIIAIAFSINKKERKSAESIQDKEVSANVSKSIESKNNDKKTSKDEFLTFENSVYIFTYPKDAKIDHFASRVYPNTRAFVFGEKQKVKNYSVFASNKLYDGYGIIVYELGKKNPKLVAEKERASHIKECGKDSISSLKTVSISGKTAFSFDAKNCKGNFSIYYIDKKDNLIKLVAYYIGGDYKDKVQSMVNSFALK